MQRLEQRLHGGELAVVASEHRSQLRNRDAAKARLAALLREAIRPGPAQRRRTRPTLAAQQRRLEDKRRRGQQKRLRHDLGD
jgi:ribosome-associated protein